MEGAKDAFLLGLYGLKDCVCGTFLLYNFLSTKETDASRHLQSLQRLASKWDTVPSSVSNILLQCAIFGVLFWFSNFVFNNYILGYLFVRFVAYMNEDIDSLIWLQKMLYCFFCISWIFPLLLLSKILNFFWYQDIADLTCKKTGIKKNTNIIISEFYADQIKSFILQVLYCIQSYIVYFLPLPIFVQHLWYLFHLSLLSSLYAFEYKWVYQGWTLHRRLLVIDRKWPYFLGFGLPLAIATTFVDSFINSMIVFATLFPIYVISSTVTFDSQSLTYNRPFHSFKVVDSISDTVVSFFLKVILGNKSNLR